MIESKDISVVIQGPVDKIYTPKCINSIRRLLPNAEVILSTWEGTELEKIDYDYCVFSQDPGCGYDGIDNRRTLNVNRWIVSSKAGVEKASRKYVLKCRSDAELINTNFLKYWGKYEKRNSDYTIAQHKIIIPSPYTMKYLGDGRKKTKIYTPFHVSDWYCFGIKDDILKFVDADLVDDIKKFARYFENQEYKIPARFRWWMNDWFRKIAAEQYIGLCYVQKKFHQVDLLDFLNWKNFNENFAEEFLVNNFIVLDPVQFGMIINKFKDFSRNIFILGNDLWPGMYRNYIYKKDYHKYTHTFGIIGVDVLNIKRKVYLFIKKGYRLLKYMKKIARKILEKIKILWRKKFGLIMCSQFFLHARPGKDVYRFIKEKYPDCDQIYVCPYRGTGDSYIVGNYFSHKKDINHSVFVVPRTVNKKILNAFGIANIEVLESSKLTNLQIFQKIMQKEDVRLLHYDAPYEHSSIGYNLAAYKKLNFADFYDYLVFNEEKPVLYESMPCSHSRLDKHLFEQIVPGKTVLLAPYSDSISSLKEEEWEYIARKLYEKGYKVFTNCGNEYEKAIPGTTPINVKFEELGMFLDACGLLISVRSGLCDIVCTSTCRKIIFYPDYIYYNYGKYLDFFTLNIKERKISADEYEYNTNDNFPLITKVLSTIGSVN